MSVFFLGGKDQILPKKNFQFLGEKTLNAREKNWKLLKKYPRKTFFTWEKIADSCPRNQKNAGVLSLKFKKNARKLSIVPEKLYF